MALEVLPVEAGGVETALINSLSFKDYPRAWVIPWPMARHNTLRFWFQHRIRQNSGSRKPLIIYEGCQDPEFWLREPVVLNISIRQGLVVCATCESHTDWHISVLHWWATPCASYEGPEVSQVVNLDNLVPSDDVIEAAHEYIRPSPTSVCSVTQILPVRRCCA